MRRVQLAWTGCITAEFAHSVALSVYAYNEQGVVAVGVVALLRTLPAAVIGPFLANLADRHPRERVLLVVLVLRAIIIGTIAAVLVLGGPAPVVYALAAADAVAYSMYWPAQSSLLPFLAATPDELTAANVASTTIENLGTLVGPIVTGVLLAVASVEWGFVAAALLLAASAVTLAPVRATAAAIPASGGSSLVAELLAGFRVLATEPAPRLVVFLYLVQTLCLGAVSVIVVVAAVDLLDLGDAGVGLLMAGIGAGGMIGSLGSLALVGRPALEVPFRTSLMVWGAALVVVGLATEPALAMAGLAVVGVCNAVVDVTALTLLQRIVDERVLARVLGVFEGFWWGALGTGAVLAAWLVDGVGGRAAVVTVGAVLPTVAVLSWRALARVDAGPPVAADEIAALAAVPMFEALPATTVERLGRRTAAVHAAPGDVVIRTGDVGDRFYVLLGGEVEVEVAETSRRRTYGPGSYFGEIALLRDVPRTATVTATVDCRLLAIERHDFLAALQGHRRAMDAASAVVAARLE